MKTLSLIFLSFFSVAALAYEAVAPGLVVNNIDIQPGPGGNFVVTGLLPAKGGRPVKMKANVVKREDGKYEGEGTVTAQSSEVSCIYEISLQMLFQSPSRIQFGAYMPTHVPVRPTDEEPCPELPYRWFNVQW